MKARSAERSAGWPVYFSLQEDLILKVIKIPIKA